MPDSITTDSPLWKAWEQWVWSDEYSPEPMLAFAAGWNLRTAAAPAEPTEPLGDEWLVAERAAEAANTSPGRVNEAGETEQVFRIDMDNPDTSRAVIDALRRAVKAGESVEEKMSAFHDDLARIATEHTPTTESEVMQPEGREHVDASPSPATPGAGVSAPPAPEPKSAQVLRRLVMKLDEVHADPRYESVWRLHQIHGGAYTGPSYAAELEEARALLRVLGGSVHAGPTQGVGTGSGPEAVRDTPPSERPDFEEVCERAYNSMLDKLDPWRWVSRNRPAEADRFRSLVRSLMGYSEQDVRAAFEAGALYQLAHTGKPFGLGEAADSYIAGLKEAL